jgi:hypothetical protein
MSRLPIQVEGRTEVDFVTKVLRHHSVAKGYRSVEARIVGNPRLRQRGGIGPWPTVRTGIVNHLSQDRQLWSIIMRCLRVIREGGLGGPIPQA